MKGQNEKDINILADKTKLVEREKIKIAALISGSFFHIPILSETVKEKVFL